MRRALLAAVLAALCLPAGAAARVPPDFFGVMANGPLDAPAFALDAESAAMHSAGVESERMEFAWDLIEPQRGQYDFALTDRKVLAAARAKIDVLALIVRSPAWAAPPPGPAVLLAARPRRLRGLRQGPRRPLRPRRVAVGRAPRGRRAARTCLAGVERAQPRRLLDRAAVHARLRAPAQRRRRGDQAGRPEGDGGHGRPRQLLMARSRAALRQGGREAALRRRGGAPVQRPAIEQREDRPPQPRRPRPPRCFAQADLAHRAHVVLGQGPQAEPDPELGDDRVRTGPAPARGLRALRPRPPGPAPGAHLLVHVGHDRPRLAELVRLLGPAHPSAPTAAWWTSPPRGRSAQWSGATAEAAARACPAPAPAASSRWTRPSCAARASPSA